MDGYYHPHQRARNGATKVADLAREPGAASIVSVLLAPGQITWLSEEVSSPFT